jgi:hypothetical protein
MWSFADTFGSHSRRTKLKTHYSGLGTATIIPLYDWPGENHTGCGTEFHHLVKLSLITSRLNLFETAVKNKLIVVE